MGLVAGAVVMASVLFIALALAETALAVRLWRRMPLCRRPAAKKVTAFQCGTGRAAPSRSSALRVRVERGNVVVLADVGDAIVNARAK
jgi:LPS O-antigen subunit length determinant protein (WzzB/FepE family)